MPSSSDDKSGHLKRRIVTGGWVDGNFMLKELVGWSPVLRFSCQRHGNIHVMLTFYAGACRMPCCDACGNLPHLWLREVASTASPTSLPFFQGG